MKWHLVLGITLLAINSCKKTTLKPNVTVYGHAGTALHKDRSVYPPNTLQSIKNAINILDAEGVEVDVQMTKDSVLVLFHDPYLDYSTKLKGCISNYNFSELKNLTIDNSKYKLVSLKTILELIQKYNKFIYLDIKSYDFCKASEIRTTTFKYALNQSMINIKNDFKNNIILGSKSAEFIENLDYPNKCFETTSVYSALTEANEHDFKNVLFFLKFITESDKTLLTNININWGIIGLKDKWTTENAMALKPNFVITDNIAYAKQLSN